MMKYQDMYRLARARWDALQDSDKPMIVVGTATCGRSAGALEVLETFQKELRNRRIEASILETGCMGLCFAEPLVTIVKPSMPGVYYPRVTSEDVPTLVEGFLVNDDPLCDRALGTVGEGSIDGIPALSSTPVFRHQVRRILRRCGLIDPTNIDHYIANGGYSGLAKALELSPAGVIEELKNSGLRGRGGAGFPTWRKWQFCLSADGDQRYIICNADEGDPGAFMNRSLLEGDPHSVLEGMLIAGYTLGASEGFIYCRAEYPLALARLAHALRQLEAHGLSGDNILGSSVSFRIHIKEGAGAFVCGEETALIASIEGSRGMPRGRPPFPAVSGLWGKPTVINNVETLASVALVLQNGSDWFAEYGTSKSTGTKVFALAGTINHTGLIEVPLGTTLEQIIYEIGGGIPNKRQFKAVQTGGPSGGCLPRSLLDIPIDYDSLAEAGSIMGSGGLVVMDEDNCMVDVARFFLEFAQKESCGKCVPCRLGTTQMLKILEDIAEGKGKPEDIDLLVTLAEAVKLGALCGLGQTAPNPVLTTIRYFREEYEAHITATRCPAKVCKSLISYRILSDKCKGCGLCLKACPVDAITGGRKQVHVIDHSQCINCGMCFESCPPKFGAVECVSGRLTKRGD